MKNVFGGLVSRIVSGLTVDHAVTIAESGSWTGSINLPSIDSLKLDPDDSASPLHPADLDPIKAKFVQVGKTAYTSRNKEPWYFKVRYGGYPEMTEFPKRHASHSFIVWGGPASANLSFEGGRLYRMVIGTSSELDPENPHAGLKIPVTGMVEIYRTKGSHADPVGRSVHRGLVFEMSPTHAKNIFGK